MSLPRLPRWLRGLTRTARPSAPRPTARSRPRLEPLEERSVPAAFPVTTLADAGPGSLRQAILDGNAAPGDDAIPIEVTGTINLTGALPDLSTNLDLQGPGAGLLTVRRDTGGDYRIFTVAAWATVSIAGLTIANGSARSGGGIANAGTLAVTACTLAGNSAFSPVIRAGGAIHNSGALTLTASTLRGNSAAGGGGIYNRPGGTVTVTGSTLSGNFATAALAPASLAPVAASSTSSSAR